MTTPQFDTLRAAKTLKRGGFDETQAETVVHTLDQAVNENFGTKTDLKLLQSEMKQGFTQSEAATDKLRSDMEKAITDANAATKQGFADAKAATDELRSDTKQGFTEANAATKQGFTEANAATDKLRSDTEKGFTEANAANKQGFADANAATDELRSDIEKAIIRSDAANEKRFAALYRFLLGMGASLVVIMITLFLVN